MTEKETIIEKAFHLLKHLLPVLAKFPRDMRFFLGDRIQALSADILERLIEAYYAPAQEKKPLLLKVNLLLTKLRYYVRLAYEQGYYGSGKLKEISEKIDEIGRMTGGWIKSL